MLSYGTMAKTDHLEIEIKIELGSFPDYLKLLGYLGPIDREEHQINAFFDSADRKLSKAGYALRVRVADRTGLVTLKSGKSQSEALAVRQEIESEIDIGLAHSIINGRTNLMEVEAEAMTVVREKFPKLKPQLITRFKNDRQVKQFSLGDHDVALEIDRTEFGDGSVDYELEIELDDESKFEPIMESLRHLFHTLAIELTGQPKSKFERALERE